MVHTYLVALVRASVGGLQSQKCFSVFMLIKKCSVNLNADLLIYSDLKPLLTILLDTLTMISVTSGVRGSSHTQKRQGSTYKRNSQHPC